MGARQKLNQIYELQAKAGAIVPALIVAVMCAAWTESWIGFLVAGVVTYFVAVSINISSSIQSGEIRPHRTSSFRRRRPPSRRQR